MKHDWVPHGIAEHKFVEAVCSVCRKQVCAGADFCDTEKIKEFWDKINQRTDCEGKRGIGGYLNW